MLLLPAPPTAPPRTLAAAKKPLPLNGSFLSGPTVAGPADCDALQATSESAAATNARSPSLHRGLRLLESRSREAEAEPQDRLPPSVIS